MAETHKEGNNLDELLLNAISKMPEEHVQRTREGSISEYIISGDSNDIKINKIEFYPPNFPNSSEYHILLSVSDGKRYKPVLYFTKEPYINQKTFEMQEPDISSIGRGSILTAISDVLTDYYSRKSTEYRFQIKYIKKGDWIKDVIKFVKIREADLKKWQDIFDAWMGGSI